MEQSNTQQVMKSDEGLQKAQPHGLTTTDGGTITERVKASYKNQATLQWISSIGSMLTLGSSYLKEKIDSCPDLTDEKETGLRLQKACRGIAEAEKMNEAGYYLELMFAGYRFGSKNEASDRALKKGAFLIALEDEPFWAIKAAVKERLKSKEREMDSGEFVEFVRSKWALERIQLNQFKKQGIL